MTHNVTIDVEVIDQDQPVDAIGVCLRLQVDAPDAASASDRALALAPDAARQVLGAAA